AATQTTSPRRQASSTARLRGSFLYPFSAGAPRERLITLIFRFFLFSTTHWIPAITREIGPPPSWSRTFTPTRSDPGATPTYFPPEAQPLPAILPATWAPWPSSS